MQRLTWKSLVWVLMAGCGWWLTSSPGSADDAAQLGAQATPVEPNMHEFMEYYFEPAFQSLQKNMASEPADRNAWKPIKANSLILAEGGNLLLFHKPYKSEDRQAWDKHAMAVRTQGGQLFAAARKRDFAAATQAYGSMIESCNACHDGFHHGKPQLKP